MSAWASSDIIEIRPALQATATPIFDNSRFPPSLCDTRRGILVVFASFVVPHNTHAHHPAHSPCSSPTLTTFFKEIAEIYAIYEIYGAGKIDKKNPARATPRINAPMTNSQRLIFDNSLAWPCPETSKQMPPS